MFGQPERIKIALLRECQYCDRYGAISISLLRSAPLSEMICRAALRLSAVLCVSLRCFSLNFMGSTSIPKGVPILRSVPEL
jgi:hypothetical protein